MCDQFCEAFVVAQLVHACLAGIADSETIINIIREIIGVIDHPVLLE